MDYNHTGSQTFTLTTNVVLAKWVWSGFGTTDITANRALVADINLMSADLKRGTGTGSITLEIDSSSDDITYSADSWTKSSTAAADFEGVTDSVTNSYQIGGSGGTGVTANAVYVRLVARRSVADGTSTIRNIGVKICCVLPNGVTAVRTIAL